MPHIHEKIDFTVEVFIVYNNRVLLRKHDKYKKWLSIGGHIELNEDPNEAAIREVKEEVGLDIELFGKALSFNNENYKELIPPKFLNRHRINDAHEHITLTYFAKSTTEKLTVSEKEISEECKWFTKEEIENNLEIEEHIKAYALAALSELKG